MAYLLDRLQHFQHPGIFHRPHSLLDPHVQPPQGWTSLYLARVNIAICVVLDRARAILCAVFRARAILCAVFRVSYALG